VGGFGSRKSVDVVVEVVYMGRGGIESEQGVCRRMEGVSEWEREIISLEPPSPTPAQPSLPAAPPRVSAAPAGRPDPASAGGNAVDPTVVLAALTASPMPAAAEDQFEPVSRVAAVSQVFPVVAAVSSVAPVIAALSPVTPIVAADSRAVPVAPGEA